MRNNLGILVAAISPPINSAGNSVRAKYAIGKIAKQLGLSFFHRQKSIGIQPDLSQFLPTMSEIVR